MWKQSVWTSAISAAISANHLKPGGVLSLTGANPALKETPGMIGRICATFSVLFCLKYFFFFALK